MPIPARDRYLAVLAVVKEKKKVSQVAKNYNVSRKTLYKWISLYNSSKGHKLSLFSSNYKSGKNHPKAYGYKIRAKLIKQIVNDPALSADAISKKLGVGRHAVADQLKNLKLSNRSDRAAFARQYQGRRLDNNIKAEIARKVLGGESVLKLSEEFLVARRTIYSWVTQYRKDGRISEKYSTGINHPKAYSQEKINLILNSVVADPERSIHALAKSLGFSSHGVFNVLSKNNLSLRNARIAYSQARKPQEVPLPEPEVERIKSVWETFTPTVAPAPPPIYDSAKSFRLRIIKSFFASTLISSVSFLLLLTWAGFYRGITFGQGIGITFATIALTFGTFFFLYSMKYYLTLALVLSFSQTSQGGPLEAQKKRGGLIGWILGTQRRRLGSFSEPINAAGGLEPNLDNITLSRHPVVSIHIPFYNEKNVVQRIINATTNFDYQGDYEVILCDDSTDETTQIIDTYLKSTNSEIKVIKEEGWSLTSSQVRPGVVVKHLHRTSRSGFKGGALALALKLVNPKTEFISIFDADFVPYPDSLTLFLKYFQATAGSLDFGTKPSNIAAVQGYQWHVLNKSENWITRGVRSEYAGSYIIERSGAEIYSGLKQISGSVYMIRRDVLQSIGWGTSITEDFELTLKLYEKGFKVVYTPYVQAPAECVSTIKRLIRQRMRWSEGHSQNIKKMIMALMWGKHGYQKNVDGELIKTFKPSPLTFAEKLEVLYLSPYYLQAFFFIVGTLSWFISETIFPAKLPFWTALWGWSLVFTNMISLPLMNAVGLFLEESEERDYIGLASFIALSYILVPFQAYASLKGFIEKEEGPWFRTPKTGRITDVFARGRFFRLITGILPGKQTAPSHLRMLNFAYQSSPYLALSSANNKFQDFKIKKRHVKWIANASLFSLVIISILLSNFARFIPIVTPVSASERIFSTIGNPEPLQIETIELKGPTAVHFSVMDGTLEYIFHKEARVRTKLDKKELELKVVSSDGLGRASPKKAYERKGVYTYEEIFPDVDLEWIPTSDTLTEQFVIKKPTDINSVTEEIKTRNLEVVLLDNQIYFSPSEGGEWVFSYVEPFMYEKNNPNEKSLGLRYELEKNNFGWNLKKVLTKEGKAWLNDPERVFPVILDPTQVTSPIEGGKNLADTVHPSVQRKIAYSTRGGGTDAWYVVYTEFTVASVFVERCLVDTNCDDINDWTNLAGVAGSGTDIDSADTDNIRPSVWLEGTTLWIAWFDNSADSVQFTSLDTTNDTLSGTVCTMPDNGNVTSAQVSIAVADDGDIFVAQHELGTIAKSTAACSITDIRTGSGFADNFEVDIVTLGNNAYVLFQDDTDLSLSIYVDDATPGWDTSNQTINSNVDTDFSIATDGTDLWIIQATTTSGADFFSCTTTNSCNTDLTSPTWTTQTDPFSGLSAGSDVSVGVVTGTTALVASIIDGSGTGEQVKYRASTDDGANWGSTLTYAFVAGASGLDNLSSTMIVANDTEFAATVLDTSGGQLEFSTLPENIWLLLLTVPVLPKLFRKIKYRRKRNKFHR